MYNSSKESNHDKGNSKIITGNQSYIETMGYINRARESLDRTRDTIKIIRSLCEKVISHP